MGSASRKAKATTVLGAIAVAALVVIPAALGAFAAGTQNENDIVTAAPDFTPPAITATVVAKSQGGITGYVRKGGGYYVYANVSADTGNPASGTATVKANVAELTSGQTEALLVPGTYTAGGASYNYRSLELTANAATEGSKGYSVTAADLAGNAGSVAGTATVDSTVPTATNVGTTNAAGGTNGLAEQGDTVTFTFSEPIDPQSILAGWNGSATSVVVRIIDNGLAALGTTNDELFVYDSTNLTQLPLGAVNLGRNDYVAGLLGGQINYGATGTASTMTMSGKTVTVTLGTYGRVGVLVGRTTAAGTGTMAWTPSATAYDWAGNATSTATANQSPAPTKGF